MKGVNKLRPCPRSFLASSPEFPPATLPGDRLSPQPHLVYTSFEFFSVCSSPLLCRMSSGVAENEEEEEEKGIHGWKKKKKSIHLTPKDTY
ncbi:hypothetical protein B9Z55_014499 [Caenorhabditis nigoni]|uniref:Uncharacterized protein n=1 Tax=Caenorhabditis nigoni TaxID=1611254 RepID=A0A2G5U6C5_9PELO|nr:hypothetical protein B9Z55_014499 [Caenorhabditis nigoni]